MWKGNKKGGALYKLRMSISGKASQRRQHLSSATKMGEDFLAKGNARRGRSILGGEDYRTK